LAHVPSFACHEDGCIVIDQAFSTTYNHYKVWYYDMVVRHKWNV